jgi:hypothetical protein
MMKCWVLLMARLFNVQFLVFGFRLDETLPYD